MYKSRLQEICQQRGWPLPEYAVSRDGPEHNPRFRATVSVNGFTFDSPDASMSSKDAQGKAAHAALDHLSAASTSAASSFQCSQGNNPMYKSQIEEICRQNMWSAPKYNVIREGPDHNPRFRATVTVNGANFDAPDLSRSSKEAQGKAAQVAVRHLALTVPSKPSPTTAPSSPSENKIPYKSQLQIYLQKKNIINPPTYDIVHDGSAPTLRFKATVTVDGRTFDSPHFFHTLREAEHDAAKVALVSLALEENPQEETILYKNLLQELLQKEGFSLPKYSTARDGASHMPIFSSVVEIEGESFVGDVARSKKQAEMNAAKVAWDQLKNRKKLEDDIMDKNDSGSITVTAIHQDEHVKPSSREIMVNDNGHIDNIASSLHNLDMEASTKEEDRLESILFKDWKPSSYPASNFSDHPTADVDSEFSAAQTNNSLHLSKVLVYPRKSGMVLPAGASVLPFSDDMWVAVSVDLSNHGDAVSV